MSGEKPREIAVEVLGRRSDRDFTEDLLERALDEARLSSPDRRLCQELVYGIVRWQATLDWLIARKTSNRTQKVPLQNLLRLGLYQIFWLDRVPDYAAVNISVELAKQRGFGAQSGFVNAILRGYLREAEATRGLLAELGRTQPHLGYSHPEWLVERWHARWGPERTAELLAWNNTPPATFARVNTLKIDPAGLLPIWRDENVEYDFVRRDWLEDNLLFELKSHPPLQKLPSFQQGFFYIQDPSTLLAVSELGPRPGEQILDLCAAPGGKLTYMAQVMHNEGRIVAHDVSSERLKLIHANCAKLGVTCVDIVSGERDRAISSARFFDRILVDVPCSNTGVLRRRVDLRWRVNLQELKRLKDAQLELLHKAAQLLKPEGTVVYSTCSLEPEENEQTVATFLKGHAEFSLIREHSLAPFTERTDGAYVALLKRA